MNIIAIDLGLKRIGLALSDGKIALPLKPVLRQNRNQAAKEVSEILAQYRAKILVFGIPFGGDSSVEMKKRANHFLGLLNFNGEVFFQDENYSSMEAQELTKDKRDGRFDSVAAMIILQRFLKQKL